MQLRTSPDNSSRWLLPGGLTGRGWSAEPGWEAQCWFLQCAPLSGHAAWPVAEDVLAVACLPPRTVTMQVARQLAPAVSPH